MIVIPQVIAAMIIGMLYYMLAVAMTVYDGILSMIFQPIMGAVFSGIAIILLLLLGLPIRIVRRVNTWWRAHWWLPFPLGTIAFVMMVLSWTPVFRVRVMNPGSGAMMDSFHPVLATGGWLLTLFAVLHFYPPLFLLKRSGQINGG